MKPIYERLDLLQKSTATSFEKKKNNQWQVLAFTCSVPADPKIEIKLH